MSGKRYRNLTKSETKRAAQLDCAARGCTCRVIVHVLRVPKPGGLEGHVKIQHHADCPLVDAGTTYSVVIHPEACQR